MTRRIKAELGWTVIDGGALRMDCVQGFAPTQDQRKGQRWVRVKVSLTRYQQSSKRQGRQFGKRGRYKPRAQSIGGAK